MERRELSYEERQELLAILAWIRFPAESRIDHLTKLAVDHFLHCEDAKACLVERGVEPFVAERACNRARTVLYNERAKKRERWVEENRNKPKEKHTFTSENFRITIDHTQDRDFGMVSVSIHCIVEVYEVDQDDPEKKYLVNFSDFKTKEWLIRLLVWGLMNKREIVLSPATEADMASMKVFIPKEKQPA